jgi:hypothetical protein
VLTLFCNAGDALKRACSGGRQPIARALLDYGANAAAPEAGRYLNKGKITVIPLGR